MLNRKETKILVENWRKVLSNGLTNNEQELLEEGIKEIIGGLALGASFLLNPSVGNALDTDEVKQGIEQSFETSGNPVTVNVTSPTSIRIISDDTGKSFDYSMPDTSGFKGSYYDKWLKTKVKSIKDWRDFLNKSETLDSDGTKNLFIGGMGNSGFSGAKYRSDLTNTHSGLLSDLNSLCEMSKSEIFELASGRLIVVGYTQDDMPITWVDFDESKLESAVNKMEKNNVQRSKEGFSTMHFNDLRKVLRSISN